MPWIRREIALAGLSIPSPVREVDLLRVIRKQFRFMSNKLENVVKMFGLPHKMETGGFGLWRDIEVGSAAEKQAAWNKMRDYCINDTAIEESLYDYLLPWIPGHPHVGLWREDADDLDDVCQNCGSKNLVREGYYYSPLGKYPRFHCRNCGKWGKSRRSVRFEAVRGVE
jgi:DNA-directed RNA polymerase subunit RPC12/RpoP